MEEGLKNNFSTINNCMSRWWNWTVRSSYLSNCNIGIKPSPSCFDNFPDVVGWQTKEASTKVTFSQLLAFRFQCIIRPKAIRILTSLVYYSSLLKLLISLWNVQIKMHHLLLFFSTIQVPVPSGFLFKKYQFCCLLSPNNLKTVFIFGWDFHVKKPFFSSYFSLIPSLVFNELVAGCSVTLIEDSVVNYVTIVGCLFVVSLIRSKNWRGNSEES